MSAGPAGRQLSTPGCVVVDVPLHGDDRGWFAKPFDAPRFAALGLAHAWAECFTSASRRGVIRGFHVQVPPSDHEKLVWVAAGASVSVALDLRRGSPMFGRAEMVELGGRGEALYLPRGVAHAFQALEDDTLLVYLVSSPHEPARDAGVRWDSVGVQWPMAAGTISARDRGLPPLHAFDTPFAYAR